jgi:hypothetical protein
VEIEHLVSGIRQVSHVSRLKFYCDSNLDVSCDLLNDISDSEALLVASYDIDYIKDIQLDPKTSIYFALIKWSGFSDLENTWETLNSVYLDLPGVVDSYLDNVDPRVAANIRLYLQKQNFV